MFDVTDKNVTLVGPRFDRLVTFKFVPKIEERFDKPDTFRLDSTPTLVIFGCDAFVTEIAVATVDTFEPLILLRVFAYIKAVFTVPNVRFEAFRLLKVLPVTATNPTTFEALILLRRFPEMRSVFTVPNVRFEAFRFPRVFE
jgi:hypothetical protein